MAFRLPVPLAMKECASRPLLIRSSRGRDDVKSQKVLAAYYSPSKMVVIAYINE